MTYIREQLARLEETRRRRAVVRGRQLSATMVEAMEAERIRQGLADVAQLTEYRGRP